MTAVVAFLVGVTFALGLGLGGMTQPARVLAFLDVTGAWDPSLAVVMIGAVAVYALAYRIAVRRRRALLGMAFALPTRNDIDPSLVAGAFLFGGGWGLAGLCPGPAITALASGEASAFLFITAMLVGMSAHRLAARVIARAASRRVVDSRRPQPA